MTTLVKIWDAEAGQEVEMFSLNAREAIAADPKRYSKTRPEGGQQKAAEPEAEPKSKERKK